ncbi:hypothetical protein K501DRAFT_238939 [Backusella circina FSU 941]|nr:hypothetical protein K501DRAFT_256674 [Backusella circina FSU 941]KAI8889171.1 hypothetical protein K501DRAFT_238939 [Backusella circina FSU 941]
MREDLIQSALSFLNDPKVQSAALAKKVSFLESKGMTAEEIEEAMARANGKSSGSTAVATTAGAIVHQQPGGGVMTAPPPLPPRPAYDWRDVFIAAVLAGGFGYGVWKLAKRLFGPWFKVPTQKEMEEDKDKLDAQFQAVEDSLKDIKDQTNTALTTVTSQSKKVEESLEALDTVISDLKKNDTQRDDDFKSLKSDIDALKLSVPKALESNKTAQTSVLTDLQNEMKSLKSLMLSRRGPTSEVTTTTTPPPAATPTTPSSSTPAAAPFSADNISSRLSATLNSNSRAGIPAWQMASSTTEPTTPASEGSNEVKN